MKITRRVLASFATLLAACLLHAADSKPIARVIAITDIETDDPGAYAVWVARYNQIAKDRLKIDPYLRVYQSIYDGHGTGRVRVVIGAASVAELSKNTAVLESDPAILEFNSQVRGMRKMGPRVLYQAIRFDGPSVKGAWNYNTLAVVTDESGYLKAIDELPGIFSAGGLKEVKIGVYRVLAGRNDHTHRITLSTSSSEQLAKLLDLMANNDRVAEWLAKSAKLRTVVANTVSKEITKYAEMAGRSAAD